VQAERPDRGHERTRAVPPRDAATHSTHRRPRDADVAGFRHEAMLYAGERGFLAGAVPFLRQGVAAGEPALVVVSPPKIALLREALGADADRVRFADMGSVGRNPARIIGTWRAFVREADGERRPLRGIGEPIDADRSAAELFECHRHEALLNLAFVDASSFQLLCPYDVTSLDPQVVACARRTHPLVRDEQGRVHASTVFEGLDAVAAPCVAPLSPAPPDAQKIRIVPAGLASMRAAVARRAERAGFPPSRREDLVLAVNELATNAICHGGGAGTLTIWETSAALMWEVTDAGRVEHPLTGREPPQPGQIGSYGLWLVNQLCDLVEQRTTPHGNLVRVSMGRD
jgi:anti-sigma regulatory factor (Ser/Thr protein kinase)